MISFTSISSHTLCAECRIVSISKDNFLNSVITQLPYQHTKSSQINGNTDGGKRTRLENVTADYLFLFIPFKRVMRTQMSLNLLCFQGYIQGVKRLFFNYQWSLKRASMMSLPFQKFISSPLISSLDKIYSKAKWISGCRIKIDTKEKKNTIRMT